MSALLASMGSLLAGPRPGLSRGAIEALRRDGRSIVITGAGGWIGRATLDLIVRCLGLEEARDRIRCFGSMARQVDIGEGVTFDQQPLDGLRHLPKRPSLVLHLAFLTKDKVSNMAAEDYRKANLALSRQVAEALDDIGADRLFVSSSGAAAFADEPQAPSDLKLYGRLKRDDEDRFAAWSGNGPGRRAVIARIFSLSGPYINKHQTYALASFILDSLRGQPIEIHAPMPVTRSYVAIRELMSLVFSALLTDTGDELLRFDSGGEPLELEQVARCVADALGAQGIKRKPLTSDCESYFAGDDLRYRALLARHGIEHVDLHAQVIETAAFLAAQPGLPK
jgi:UDP-glucuronate decarboxylase